jgi:hypothetical protein
MFQPDSGKKLKRPVVKTSPANLGTWEASFVDQ